MTISPEYIRKRLMQEKYEEVIVTDLGRFDHMIARKNGKFTDAGLASRERADKWADSSIPYQPLLFAPKLATPNQFINCVKQMNKKDPRMSECSNFAYHAIGVLLDDPAIRAEYNIAVVGAMGGLHNIAVMVPKGIDIPAGGPLPRGSLIVDPWAVGMGHAPNRALAVPPEEFAYYDSLYENFTVHWQSNDTKFAVQMFKLEKIEEKDRLSPYSGKSPTVASSVAIPPESAEAIKPAQEKSQGFLDRFYSLFESQNFSSSSSEVDDDLKVNSSNTPSGPRR